MEPLNIFRHETVQLRIKVAASIWRFFATLRDLELANLKNLPWRSAEVNEFARRHHAGLRE